MNPSVCRWGILSAAAIARKNWRALALNQHCRLVAVGARQKKSAIEFIEACQAHTPMAVQPEAVEGYEALLHRQDIDAVYIPLPTAVRGDWIRRALEAGKHVLAEKPAALNASELQSLLQLAGERGRQYMDGVMFMHSHRLAKLRAVIDDGAELGGLKRMAAHFSFRGDEEFAKSNIRAMSHFEPHGCLGDLGWYCLRAILWAKHYQLPQWVTGRVLATMQGNGSPETVPAEFSGEMWFADGFSASFYCSFLTENQQWFHLSGEKGQLTVKDFVLPHYGCATSYELARPVFRVDGCDFHMQEQAVKHQVAEYSEGHWGAQEVEMFRHFSELVSHQRLEPKWGEITLATQRLMDAVYRSAMNHSQPLAP